MHYSSRTAVLLPLILLLLALAACNDTATTPASTTATKAPQPSPTATPEPHHKVGDTVTRDGLAITLVSIKLIDPASISQYKERFPYLKPTQVFLLLNEKVTNTTTKDQKLMGGNLILQDDQGHNPDVQSSLPDVDTSEVGGSIAPGMKQSGAQVYIVDKAMHTFYLSYHATTGSIAVWDIHV